MKTSKRSLTALVAATMAAFFFAGCSSQLEDPAKTSGSILNEPAMVLVPGRGYVSKDIVHEIEPGYHLMREGSHLFKIETATGKKALDYGDFKDSNSISQMEERTDAVPSGTNPNWIAYSSWTNPSGQPPINYFSTTWAVPATPGGSDNQTLFIFDALNANDGSTILQPVLQWGISAAGGGNRWAISNWYIQSGFVGFTALYDNSGSGLAPGTSLQGVMSYSGQQAGTGSQVYTSGFNGYSNSLNLVDGLTISGGSANTIPLISILQNTATETLEAYGAAGGSSLPGNGNDYPVGYVAMKNITLQTSNGYSSLFWASVNPYQSYSAPLGQFVMNVSNNTSGSGEVDIYFGCTTTRSVSGFVWVNPADEFFWNYVPGATSYVVTIPGATTPTHTSGGSSIADARNIFGLTSGHQYNATIYPVFPCGNGPTTPLTFTP